MDIGARLLDVGCCPCGPPLPPEDTWKDACTKGKEAKMVFHPFVNTLSAGPCNQKNNDLRHYPQRMLAVYQHLQTCRNSQPKPGLNIISSLLVSLNIDRLSFISHVI